MIIKLASLSLIKFDQIVVFLFINFYYEKVRNTSLIWVFNFSSKLNLYQY